MSRPHAPRKRSVGPPPRKLAVKPPAHDTYALLAGVLAAASNATAVVNKELGILLWNPRAEKLFREGSDIKTAKSLLELVPERLRTMTREKINASLARSRVHSAPERIEKLVWQQANGQEFLMDTEIVLLKLNRRTLVCITWHDTRERHELEREIQYQANLLAQVSDAIITTDLQFRVVTWNRAAELLYGWRAAQVVGEPLGNILSTVYPGVSRAQVMDEFREQGRWAGQVIQHHQDGTALDILASVALVRDPAGEPVGAIAVNRDITARTQAERALVQANLRLEERIAERTGELQTELGVRQQHEQELRLRLLVTQMLASASRIEDAAPRLLQTIGEPLQWDYGELYEFDALTDESTTYSWHVPDPILDAFAQASQSMTLPREQGLAGQVIKTRRAVWIPDAPLDPRVKRARLLERAGLHGVVAFPIQVADSICGMVFFFSRAVRTRDEEQLALLLNLGSEISQFMSRQRSETMLNRANQDLKLQVDKMGEILTQMGTLYTISHALVLDMDLPGLLQTIADTLVGTMPANRVTLICLDVQLRRIEYFIKSGPGAGDIVAVDFGELWEGLSGWAIRNRQTASSPNGAADERETPAVRARRAATNSGAILVVPLLFQDRILGTITAINRPDEPDFEPEAVNLIQVIADQAAATIERKRAEEKTRQQNNFLSALNQITLDLLNRRDLQELLDTIVEAATRLLDAPFGEIMLVEGDELVVVAFTANQPFLRGDRSRRDQAPVAWQAFDSRTPVLLEDYSAWEHHRTLYDSVQLHAVADLPIFIGERGIGVLALARDQRDYPFDTEQVRYGTLFARLVAVVLENSRMRESLRDQAIRDPLTGLYNRRYLQDRLESELQHAVRTSSPLSLLLLDLDHFKNINDTYGHSTGDLVLETVADALSGQLRPGDVACRYGGEEFVLVLVGANLQGAAARAQDLRHKIEKLEPIYQGIAATQLTISIGVAAYPRHGATVQELIERADAALYQAKQQGRNRVVVAADG